MNKAEKIQVIINAKVKYGDGIFDVIDKVEYTDNRGKKWMCDFCYIHKNPPHRVYLYMCGGKFSIGIEQLTASSVDMLYKLAIHSHKRIEVKKPQPKVLYVVHYKGRKLAAYSKEDAAHTFIERKHLREATIEVIH